MLLIILSFAIILLETLHFVINSIILIYRNHLILLYKLCTTFDYKKKIGLVFSPSKSSPKTLSISNVWYSDIIK